MNTNDLASLLDRVRTQQPLVHHLTNWVTIYDCAQVVKVFGASPVMAHAPEEVASMTSLASSLVLNIGTLTTQFVQAMRMAASAANKKKIPVVLDVCGAGATAFRTKACMELLDSCHIDIIKGNMSEVAVIAGKNVQTKGVDATAIEHDLVEIASQLARQRACVVVITGKDDIVSDTKRSVMVKNGHELMSRVVGTGCMAASVIGTFAAVTSDRVVGAAAGLCCYEIAAERAAALCKGPGTFKETLFDCIAQLTVDDVRNGMNIAKV